MGLMAINIGVFVWMAIKDSGSLGGELTQTHVDLGLNAIPLRFGDEWYRLVTSGFVHFGIIHLAFNMFMLYQLGQLLERWMTPVQFALLYFASLLGGSFGVLLLQGESFGVTAGASGAIFGLLGAAAVGMHRRGVNIFSTGIGTTLILNLFITFSVKGISIGGHLGGLVAGAICGFLMLAPAWKRVPKWTIYAVPLAVALVCVVGSVIYVGTLDFTTL